MPLHIRDIQTGDTIQVWMRNGLAIQPRRTAKGVLYYAVPNRTGRARAADLTRFWGLVVQNNPDTGTGIITVQVTPYNSRLQAINETVPKQAVLAYSALHRVRKLSAVTYAGRPEVVGDRGTRTTRRPGSVAPFGGTANRPYKTLTEVILR